jgi:hypothetical protein
MNKLLLLPLLPVFITSITHADVLANWNLDSLAGGEASAVVTDIAAGVSVNELTGGEGLKWANALAALPNGTGANSLANAIELGDCFSFTLTPNAGEVSYDSIFVRVTVGANVQPATPRFSLLSSVTGFSSSDALDTFDVSMSTNSSNGAETLDLSGLGEVEGPVEFRIYYHDVGPNPTHRVAIGKIFSPNGTPDLTVNGTVAGKRVSITEPSTYAGLLGLVAFGAAMLRRRI